MRKTITFRKRQEISKMAAKKILNGSIVFGFSGYSTPPANSHYTEKSETLLLSIFDALENSQQKFSVVYSGSDTGIDRSIEQIWEQRGKSFPLIGITCQKFFTWVPDEKKRPPIIIYKHKSMYFDVFHELLNILILTGGRDHALNYDLLAIAKGKYVYTYDCAPEVEAFQGNKITNAAKVIQQYIAPSMNKETLINTLTNYTSIIVSSSNVS